MGNEKENFGTKIPDMLTEKERKPPLDLLAETQVNTRKEFGPILSVRLSKSGEYLLIEFDENTAILDVENREGWTGVPLGIRAGNAVIRVLRDVLEIPLESPKGEPYSWDSIFAAFHGALSVDSYDLQVHHHQEKGRAFSIIPHKV